MESGILDVVEWDVIAKDTGCSSFQGLYIDSQSDSCLVLFSFTYRLIALELDIEKCLSPVQLPRSPFASWRDMWRTVLYD